MGIEANIAPREALATQAVHKQATELPELLYEVGEMVGFTVSGINIEVETALRAGTHRRTCVRTGGSMPQGTMT
jgi:hypothetical protein